MLLSWTINNGKCLLKKLYIAYKFKYCFLHHNSFIMKYIIVISLFILMGYSLKAQDADVPKRNISLVILDKKGRPVDKIVVHALNNTVAGMTDRNGLFVFTDMTDDDKISMFLPKYGETIIPVAGMDSIVVTLRSAGRYSYAGNERQSVIVFKKDNAEANTVLDVPALVNKYGYKTVTELLRARVPGLNFSASSSPRDEGVSSIRGNRSLQGSNAPLIVLDGRPRTGMSLNDISIHEIKTIEVQKSASEWGSQGANGVILINTK